jgi:hypothetical protein
VVGANLTAARFFFRFDVRQKWNALASRFSNWFHLSDFSNLRSPRKRNITPPPQLPYTSFLLLPRTKK